MGTWSTTERPMQYPTRKGCEAWQSEQARRVCVSTLAMEQGRASQCERPSRLEPFWGRQHAPHAHTTRSISHIMVLLTVAVAVAVTAAAGSCGGNRGGDHGHVGFWQADHGVGQSIPCSIPRRAVEHDRAKKVRHVFLCTSYGVGQSIPMRRRITSSSLFRVSSTPSMHAPHTASSHIMVPLTMAVAVAATAAAGSCGGDRGGDHGNVGVLAGCRAEHRTACPAHTQHMQSTHAGIGKYGQPWQRLET